MKICRSCDCSEGIRTPCAKVCITVNECGDDTGGATVHVKTAGVDVSGSPTTTPSDGRVCFEFEDAVPDVTITVDRHPLAAYLWPQATYDLGDVGRCESHVLTVDFADPDLWLCGCGPILPKFASVSATYKVGSEPTRSLTMTSPDPTGLGGIWGGCRTETTVNLGLSDCSDFADSGDIPIAWSLSCNTGGELILMVKYPGCATLSGRTNFARLGQTCANITGGTATGPYITIPVGQDAPSTLNPLALTIDFTIPNTATYDGFGALFSQVLPSTLHFTASSGTVDPATTPAVWGHTSESLPDCHCPETCTPGTICFPVQTCACPDGSPLGGIAGPDQATWTMTLSSDAGFLGVAEMVGCMVCFSVDTLGTYTFDGPDSPCYESNGTQSVIVDRCDGTLHPYSQTLVSKTYTARIRVAGCANYQGWYLQDALVVLSGPPGSGVTGLSGTTDSDGWATIAGVPADCDIMATAYYDRFADTPSQPLRSECNDWDYESLNFSEPIPGYRCSYCVPYPIPTVLRLLDSRTSELMHLAPGFGFTVYALCYDRSVIGMSTPTDTAQCSATAQCEREEFSGDLLLNNEGWAILYQFHPDLEDSGFSCFLVIFYSGCLDGTTPRIAKGDCPHTFGFPATACIQQAIATLAIPAPQTPPFVIEFGTAEGPAVGLIVISE